MWFQEFYFIILITFSQSANEASWNRFTKIECTLTDPKKIFNSHFCFVKNYNRTSSTFSAGFSSSKPLDNALMDIEILYKFLTSYRQIIHMPKVDICKLFQDSNANLFLRQPFETIKASFPSIDFRCPIKELFLNNVSMDMTGTSQLFPAGHYKNVYILSNNEGIVFKVILSILNFSKDKGEI